MADTILLVGPYDFIFDSVQARLSSLGHSVVRRPDAKAFLADPQGIDAATVLVAPGSLPVGETLLARAPVLRAVISPFTGTEGFDRAAATRAGVLVVSGQIPENYEGMAEATILLVLASLYDLPAAQAQFHEGRYQGRTSSQVRLLKGKTLGMIGLGMISRAIAARLSTWGVRLLAYAPRFRDPPPAGVEAVSLDDLLTQSDVVCVLAALNDETRGMLGAPELARMKSGAVLVNTARGGIIDEAALAAAAGRFKMIALDVFENEPLEAASPLRGLPNAILTPHAIGHSEEVVERIPHAVFANILAVLEGRTPPTTRNPEAAAVPRPA